MNRTRLSRSLDCVIKQLLRAPGRVAPVALIALASVLIPQAYSQDNAGPEPDANAAAAPWGLDRQQQREARILKIALSFQMFTTDAGGRHPDNLYELVKFGYLKDEAVLTNPARPDLKLGYVYVKPEEVSPPQDAIALYEAYDVWPEGGIMVATWRYRAFLVEDENWLKERVPPARTAEPASSEPEPKTVEELLGRMAEARKAVRSASYKLKKQTFEVFGDMRAPAGSVIMAEQKCVIEGTKCRHELKQYVPDLLPREVEGRTVELTETYDGEVARSSAGTVNTRPKGPNRHLPRGIRLFHFGPQFVSKVYPELRPHTPVKLAGKKEELGRVYYLLVEEFGSTSTVYTIDPARDWALTRVAREVTDPDKREVILEDGTVWYTGLSESETEITYEKDESGLWRPAEWTWKLYQGWGPTRKLATMGVTVVEEAELNVDVPAETFTIDFPDGTRMYDPRLNVNYVLDKSIPPEELQEQVNAKALSKAAGRQEMELVRELLDNGTDVNAVDEYERTALHLAARNGDREMVEFLLEKGADINAVNKVGRTPLSLAVMKGHKEIANVLRERGGIE